MDRSVDIAAREPHRMPDFSLPDDWQAGGTFMGRVRLDVNTAPEYAGAFSGDAKIGVATELLRIGEELATKGDVP